MNLPKIKTYKVKYDGFNVYAIQDLNNGRKYYDLYIQLDGYADLMFCYGTYFSNDIDLSNALFNLDEYKETYILNYADGEE